MIVIIKVTKLRYSSICLGPFTATKMSLRSDSRKNLVDVWVRLLRKQKYNLMKPSKCYDCDSFQTFNWTVRRKNVNHIIGPKSRIILTPWETGVCVLAGNETSTDVVVLTVFSVGGLLILVSFISHGNASSRSDSSYRLVRNYSAFDQSYFLLTKICFKLASPSINEWRYSKALCFWLDTCFLICVDATTSVGGQMNFFIRVVDTFILFCTSWVSAFYHCPLHREWFIRQVYIYGYPCQYCFVHRECHISNVIFRKK